MPIDQKIQSYVEDFVRQNKAAAAVEKHLSVAGVGLRPVADHITFRTLDVEKRAKEFTAEGFSWDKALGNNGIIEYNDWWAKVYRRAGFPAIFIDQAYDGKRGESSLIPGWVKQFGDQTLHHVAIAVEDIEKSIAALKKLGIECAGEIVGARGSDLRQIFTKAEVKNGQAFSVVELTERHNGYAGFLPPQADGLMKSSVEKAYKSSK
ncbi:MAG: hypothetical protein HY587_01805 [Candidatus Omnitrophica bacterium]|nr:hypothetical protein [Candidatus Omnitrophota bacterium]